MKIAIIGGGITGLTAAFELCSAGHAVTVFEKESFLGGLAYGFKRPHWKWHLEGAYHHLFTNDRAIITLMKRLGISDKRIITRPVTSTLWNGTPYQLDSPLALIRFPALTPFDKFRTALLLAFLKFNPFWKILEYFSAEHLLISIGGKKAWNTIWEPLLYGKFGTYAPHVSASWFWARIVKRTPSLCYIEGGFHTLIESLVQAIHRRGGTVKTSKGVTNVKRTGTKLSVSYGKTNASFDCVLVTVPTPLAQKIVPIIPESYIAPLHNIPHLFAQTLILETNRPLLRNSIYWLNVTDRTYPFLAAVAHTNFINPSHYGGKHLTYFGNYLPVGHRYLAMNRNQLLKEFLPYIRKLSPNISTEYKTLKSYLFVGPFAQPVHERLYSRRIPQIQTPIPNLFMANMDYIVPWDRGTNYAVELGLRAARTILENMDSYLNE